MPVKFTKYTKEIKSRRGRVANELTHEILDALMASVTSGEGRLWPGGAKTPALYKSNTRYVRRIAYANGLSCSVGFDGEDLTFVATPKETAKPVKTATTRPAPAKKATARRRRAMA